METGNIILKTDRLTLREITVDDVDRLYEIYSGPGITDFIEPLYEDRDEEIVYTRDYIKYQYGFYGYGLWIVVENDTGRIVGRAGLTNRAGYLEAELAYVIEKERQGRGYAQEALNAIVAYARDELYLEDLNCFVIPGNDISVHLCEKLGFEYMEDADIDGIVMRRYHLSL
ncbi:MAG: GNAT family N-acetyltransferase [Lachnospiraceae bacterium]|nr:GNAT family N-acetyltransferase [Lachnospiraceae bacterium]